MQRSQNSFNYQESLNQNSIHIDSKWIKQTIPVTGSVEATLILSECIVYHQNRYRSFAVDNQQRYGLLTSLSEIQRNYNISYKRAKKIVKDLRDKNLVNIHEQKFVYNRKFYTPTQKALNVFEEIHLKRRNQLNQDTKKVETPLPIDQSTFRDWQNSYKDEYKDKKNNNHKNQKNCSLLKNLKTQNTGTVIFDFSKFNFGKIVCEEHVLQYLTSRQREVIDTVIYCYHDILDIMVFNQTLYRSDFKDEASNFKQLVSWAYLKATKRKQDVFRDTLETDNYNNSVKKYVFNSITIESRMKSLSTDKTITSSKTYNHNTTLKIPELTAEKIQVMIKEKQKELMQNTDSKAQIQLDIDNRTRIKMKNALASQAQYLLSSSNKLYLIETLSSKGVNDAQLIIQTAENIITKYPRITFNGLLNGIVYQLYILPEHQRQKEKIQEMSPMEIERARMGINSIDNDTEKIRNQNYRNRIIPSIKKNPSKIFKAKIKCIGNIDNKFTGKSKNINSKNLNNTKIIEHKKILNEENNIAFLKYRSEGKINEIRSKKLSKFFNKNSLKNLIDGLNEVGVNNKKNITEKVIGIVNEHRKLNLQTLLEGIIYQLIKIPLKQKIQNQVNQSLTLKIKHAYGDKTLKVTHKHMTKISKLNDRYALLQKSDITMPKINSYRLIQK